MIKITRLLIELVAARPSAATAEKMFEILTALPGPTNLGPLFAEEVSLVSPDNEGGRGQGIMIQAPDFDRYAADGFLGFIEDEIKPHGWRVSPPVRHKEKTVRPGT